MQLLLSKNFEEYSRKVFIPYVNSQLQVARQVDVIWDRYFHHSLKTATREKRGKGICRRVRADSNIPGNWQAFLREAESKKELFSYLADRVITIGAENGEVISTKKDSNLQHRKSSC